MFLIDNLLAYITNITELRILQDYEYGEYVGILLISSKVGGASQSVTDMSEHQTKIIKD